MPRDWLAAVTTRKDQLETLAHSRAYAIAPTLAIPIAYLTGKLATIVAAVQPCEIPNAGAPLQLGVSIFVFLLLIAGMARFGGALLGFIFNNGVSVVAGVALFFLALWVAGGIESLIPFFYEQVSGQAWGQSGLQCAVPGASGGNNSSQ